VKKSTAVTIITANTTTSSSSSPRDNISQQQHQQHHLYETFNAIHHQTIVDYNNKDNNIQQINKLENIPPSDIIINKHNNKLINNDIIGMDSINNSSSSGSFLNKHKSGSVDEDDEGGDDDGCFNDSPNAATSTQKQVKSEIVKNLHNIKQKSYENDENDVVDCYNQKIINNQVITKYSEKQRRQQQQRSESLSSSSSRTANKIGGGSSNSSHDADDDDDEIQWKQNSVPSSPTSFTTPILQDGCYCAVKKKRDLQQAISAPTSPETSSTAASGGVVPTTASQDLIRRSCSNSQNHTQNGEFYILLNLKSKSTMNMQISQLLFLILRDTHESPLFIGPCRPQMVKRGSINSLKPKYSFLSVRHHPNLRRRRFSHQQIRRPFATYTAS
jgi:hypothetical protein